jgi:hypothetical protein
VRPRISSIIRGFPGPGVPKLLGLDCGVSGLGEEKTDSHRLVVAERDYVSGHWFNVTD